MTGTGASGAAPWTRQCLADRLYSSFVLQPAIMHAVRDHVIADLNENIFPIISDDINIGMKPQGDMDVPTGPVTLTDLLTHSGGFEDKLMGLFTKDIEEPADQEEALIPFPSRVRKAKEAYAYSNHGIALAAYAVGRLLNQTFHEYVKKVVFEPLGMEDTTMMIQDPKDAVAVKRAAGKLVMAKGHAKTADGWATMDEIALRAVAAGNVATTTEDMARYMKFHLGATPNDQVLSTEDVELMRKPHFQNSKALRASSGITWQLMQLSHKTTLVSHLGDFLYARSFCGLFPASNVGLFFNIPRTEDMENRELATFMNKVVRDFIVRFVDPTVLDQKPEPARGKVDPVYLKTYEGVFAPTRRAYMDVEALALPHLTRSQIKIKVADAGDALEIEDMTGKGLQLLGWQSTPVQLVPLGGDGDVFRVVPKSGAQFSDEMVASFLTKSPNVAFGRDSTGKVKYLFIDQGHSQYTTFDRVSFWASYPFFVSIVLPCFGVHALHALLSLPGVLRWLSSKSKKTDDAAKAKKDDDAGAEPKEQDDAAESKEEEAKGGARKRKGAKKEEKGAKSAEAAPAAPTHTADGRPLPQFGPDPVDPASDPYDNEWVPGIAAALSIVNTVFLIAFFSFVNRGFFYFLVDVGANRLPFGARFIFLLPMLSQLLTIPLLTQVVMGSLAWIQRRATITVPASRILPRLLWFAVLAASGLLIMLETAYFRMSFFDM